jgi:hypothetical protein
MWDVLVLSQDFARGCTICFIAMEEIRFVDSVVGVLRTRPMAERVVDILLGGGFQASDVSVLDWSSSEPSPEPVGASAADASLLVTGGIAAARGGVGTLALGGLSGAPPAAGPGGLAGFFVDHGVPPALADTYAEDIRDGGYVVMVHTDDDEALGRVRAIVDALGAAAESRSA